MAFGDKINKNKNIYNSDKNSEDKGSDIYIDGWKFNTEDKWKLVSYLHKSIRHGKGDEAAAAAKWIYHLDSAYARYRMAVIAFEDVAGGSPEVVIESMSGGWKKEDIESQGGHVFIQEQARKWALARKDRTANDWVICSKWIPEYLNKYQIKDLETQTIEEAIEISFKEESTWWEKGLAAWRIAGTKKFPNSYLGKFEGDWERWLTVCKEKGVSDLTLKCMHFGTATQKEGSPIFLPFVDLAMKNEKVKEITSQFIDLGHIGPYASSSIDKHTSEGKKALDYYLEINQDLAKWLIWKNISFDVAKEIIAKIQFWLEGGVLDKSYSYQTKNKINEDIRNRVQADYHVNGSEFFKMVNDYNNWHEARKKAVKFKSYL